MKKIALILVITLSIGACKKEKQETSIPLVKTINDGTEIDTLKYDSNNRLIENNIWGGHAFTFSYFSTDSVVTYFDNKRYGLATFNTFNQHVKSRHFNFSGDVMDEYNYYYDANGKMVYRVYYNLSGAGAVNYEKDSNYYSGNNCTMLVNMLKLGTGAGGYFKDTYTKVFLDKKNTLRLDNFGLSINDDQATTTLKYDEFIRSTFYDENLVSEFHDEYGNLVLKFEYEFDNHNRVTKRVRKHSGIADYVEIFTYY